MMLFQRLLALVTVAVVVVVAVEGNGQAFWLSLLEGLEKSTKNEILSQDSPPDTVRCDHTYVCPYSFSCCKFSVGYYCCPSGTTCGTTPMTCSRNVLATPLLTKVPDQGRSLIQGPEESTKNEVLSQDSPLDTVRCDDTFVCPDSFSCCKISVGYYCCPSGTTCGTTPMTCNRNVFATPLLEKNPNFNKERINYRGSVGEEQVVLQGILQPGLKVGDQRHEQQRTGDLQQRAGPTSLGEKGETNSQDVTQDDDGLCPPRQTACLSPTGTRCCPVPHASCCSDGRHCCRIGFHCVNNMCRFSGFPLFHHVPDSETKLPGTPSSNVLLFNQQQVRTRPGTKARTRFEAAEPDGAGFGSGTQTGASSPGDGLVSCNATVSCTQHQTCCMLSTGGWGCCRYQNATCCKDGLHCCPSGYTCDQTNSSCSKNGMTLDWSLKHRALKKKP